MARYECVDLKLTFDGDLAYENGDLALAKGSEFLDQQVYNRLHGSNPGWFNDSICADLEDLLGEPNSKATADRGIEMIEQSLIHDGLIDADDIYIRAIPTSHSSIAFFLFINSPFGREPAGFEINLHLSSGAKIKKV